MTMALVKYTARRGKTIETTRRDVIGHVPDDPEQLYEELARIIGSDIFDAIENQTRGLSIKQEAEKNAL